MGHANANNTARTTQRRPAGSFSIYGMFFTCMFQSNSCRRDETFIAGHSKSISKVLQMRLTSSRFWQTKKKIVSNNLANEVGILEGLAKVASFGAYMRALLRLANEPDCDGDRGAVTATESRAVPVQEVSMYCRVQPEYQQLLSMLLLACSCATQRGVMECTATSAVCLLVRAWRQCQERKKSACDGHRDSTWVSFF